MGDDQLVEMPAAELRRAVALVLEDTSPLAGEARFVADEVIRLRDAGHLSKSLAGDLVSLIYQRDMHSAHAGEFQLTEPIRVLQQEIDRHAQARFPDAQVDPIHVNPRLLDIIA